ncbi:MAG: 2-dehydro-3-deoxyphosphogluconate aldolase, partial [Deltaproteobacteria bacterium]
GISTPTDIQVAHEFGLDIVKFFPAEAFGGLKTLKAMSAPYQMMKFIPTGGIGPQNVLEYLKHPKVPACGGSWMVKSNLISDGKFEEITRLSREAVGLAQKASEPSD